MDYWTWNEAISRHFFKEEYAGRRVVLYLDRTLIDKIGSSASLGGWNGFMEAIRRGPEGYARGNYPLELLQDWDGPGPASTEKPPYFMALLGLLVLAWTERNESQYGYYSAFQDLLDAESLRFSSNPRSLALALIRGFSMVENWCRALHGRLGMCYDEQLYVWRHVGRVKYHALLRPEERQWLHFLWADSGLNRNASPGQGFLVTTTAAHPRAGELVPGILQLLRHPMNKVRQAAGELLEIDFQSWDGKFPDPGTPEGARQSQVTELKLCLDRQGQLGFRLCHPELTGEVEFPWQGNLLRGVIGEDGWSDWLSRSLDGTTYHPDPLSLAEPERLTSQTGLPVNFDGRPVIRLVPAESLGAPGRDYISARIWDRNRRNLVLCRYGETDWKDQLGGRVRTISQPSLSTAGWLLHEVGPEVRRKDNRPTPLSPTFRLRGGRKNVLGQYSLHALPQLLAQGVETPPKITIHTESPYLNALRLEPVEDVHGEFLYSIDFEPDYQPAPAGDHWILRINGQEEIPFTVYVRLPIRQYSNDAAWTFSHLGELLPNGEPGISHVRVQVPLQPVPPVMDKIHVEMEGGSEPPPIGHEFPERLLECGFGSGEASYERLFRVIADWMDTVRGFPADPIEVRLVRQRLAAMGYYLAQQESRKVQLAPPSLVRMPDNLYRIRFLLTGIWTRPLLDRVRAWCEKPSHQIRMQWVRQWDLVLPPMAVLETVDLDCIHQLAESLDSRYPGYINCESDRVYALELLRNLSPTREGDCPYQATTIKRMATDPGETFLDPDLLMFSEEGVPGHFPAISMQRHYRMLYPEFTWWTDATTGYPCHGATAIWKLLAQMERPFLFRDEHKSDRIYLPRLVAPPLLERGLVHASGRAGTLCHFTTPAGAELQLVCYDGIRSGLRREIPRILFGLTDMTRAHTFFHALNDFIDH